MPHKTLVVERDSSFYSLGNNSFYFLPNVSSRELIPSTRENDVFFCTRLCCINIFRLN